MAEIDKIASLWSVAIVALAVGITLAMSSAGSEPVGRSPPPDLNSIGGLIMPTAEPEQDSPGGEATVQSDLSDSWMVQALWRSQECMAYGYDDVRDWDLCLKRQMADLCESSGHEWNEGDDSCGTSNTGSQTDDLDNAHDKITQYMQLQNTHLGMKDELPLFMSLVDRASNELVVGLDRSATGTAEQYIKLIRQIINNYDVQIRLVSGDFTEGMLILE